eukprot:Cvel_23949.t1-p1 / transcript=Cvel_23949.t1 / gene=Cvel_23949 / organism=Chromera_velia_CCMP2878 / gene_product=hypothetical protein / transcript_product=hypothetical protein / location=Cvel_scaffold2531:23823-26434(+) / protein_length=358 / sequence_SO=supercontig / SO=protein_coding / is_pseudo=false
MSSAGAQQVSSSQDPAKKKRKQPEKEKKPPKERPPPKKPSASETKTDLRKRKKISADACAFYIQENRHTLSDQSYLSPPEVAVILRTRWRQLPEAEKAKWQKQADEEAERIAEEKKAAKQQKDRERSRSKADEARPENGSGAAASSSASARRNSGGRGGVLVRGVRGGEPPLPPEVLQALGNGSSASSSSSSSAAAAASSSSLSLRGRRSGGDDEQDESAGGVPLFAIVKAQAPSRKMQSILGEDDEAGARAGETASRPREKRGRAAAISSSVEKAPGEAERAALEAEGDLQEGPEEGWAAPSFHIIDGEIRLVESSLTVDTSQYGFSIGPDGDELAGNRGLRLLFEGAHTEEDVRGE